MKMKITKKWMGIVMCLVFAVSMMAGCGTSSGKAKGIALSTESEALEKVQETDTETKVSVDEQVLVEQDGITIKAMEYVTDSIWGDGIKLLIENDSKKDYTVGCDALIVNDYMIADLFATEIAAGKKANETMYLSSSELKAAGIDTVGKIEIYFHAYDADCNNVFQNVYSEIKTSEYDNMDTKADDTGVELYNKNGIRIVGKTVDENSFWGTAILLYCENTSGKNVGISVEDMAVNGFMMDPLFSTTVYDNKKAIDDITILSSDLEENGIESIEEVELKFHIYDSDTYDTIADSEPITFSAQE